MSLLRRSAVGFAYNHVGKTLDFGLAYLFSVVLARRLGVDGFGAYATAISLSTLSALVCSLGLDEALQKYVAQLANQPQKVRYIVRRALVFRLLAVATLVVILLLGRNLVADLLGSAAFSELVMGVALYVAGLSLLNFFSSLFVARLRTQINLILFASVRLLNLSLVFLLLARGWGVKEVLVLIAATAFLGVVGFAFLARGDLLGRTQPVPTRPLWRFGVSVWGVGFLSLALGKQSDVLLLSAFWGGGQEVGYYEAAFSLLRLVGWTMTIGFTGVLLSTFSGIVSSNLDRLGEARLVVMKFLQTLVLPLGIFMLFNSSSVIRLIYSEAYLPSARLFSVAIVFSLFGWAFGGGANQTALYAAGRQGLVLRIRALFGVVNLLVNLLVIPRYGALGAIAVTSAMGLSNAITEYVYANRIIAIKFPLSYFAKIVAVSLVALVMIRAVLGAPMGLAVLGAGTLYTVLVVVGFWVTRLLGDAELALLRRLRTSSLPA
jgi:O-antigen/teichoic acid export membrane protein